MSLEVKCSKWAFTSWKMPSLKLHNLIYMIWQKEKCSNGLEHYQGYVEFKNEYKLSYVKSLFKDKQIHLEHARKGRKANKIYCSKNESYADMRFEYGDIDTGIICPPNSPINDQYDEDPFEVFGIKHKCSI